MWFALSLVAHAVPEPPWYGGFASVSRGDAPRDARLVVQSNVPLAPVLLVGDDPPVPLGTSVVREGVREGEGRIAVYPPEGGWPTNVPLTVRADARDGFSGTDTLNFTAIDRPSPPAETPLVVGEPALGPWIAGEVPGGCCGEAREVTIVTGVAANADPWSLFSLSTTEGEIETVDAEVLGDGTVALTWPEWRWDEETLFDRCVALFHVGAAGDSSPGVTVCAEELPPDYPTGCASSPGSALGAAVALGLALRRSRRRTT